MGCINSKGIEGGKPVHGSWRKSLKRLISSPEREDAEIKDADEILGRESVDGGRKRLILELEENGVNPALFLHDNGNMKAETAFNEIKGSAVNKRWVSFDERADPVDHVLVSDDAEKKQRWQQQQQTLVISSVPNGAVSEHVVAGWPSWLTKVAGDAVKGWLPRKLDSFSNIEKIGQGTYSTVYQARDLVNDKIVALKKVRFVNLDPESVRFMAREIYVLRKLDHPNVIKLEGLVASRMSSSLWLVFQYMEHDLAGLAARPGIKFTLSQVKCFMKQLFDGLNHCHSNGVLHRDIKGANLLMNDDGILKIADFGLATFFSNEPKHPLTSRVVTLWYRPPELLLGSQEYGVSVDLWSGGCILAELLSRKPIMPGRTEVEQLHMIFKLCGSPSEEYWRKSKLPHATVFKPQHPYKSNISQEFKDFPPPAVALLEVLLAVDPADRGTSSSALKCEFFATEPIACDPSGLPKWPPSKEFDAKRRRDAEAGRQRDSTKNGNGNGSERHVLKDTNGNPILDANAHLQISRENSGGSDTRNHPRGTAENGFVPVSRNPKANLQHAMPGIPSSKFNRLNSHCASWTQRSSLTNGRSARLSGLSGPIESSLTSTNFQDQFCHPRHMAGSSHNQLDEARLFDKRSSSHRREVSGREPSAADQVPRRSRIAYSGPLMPAADNIEEMLKEHERQIELAIRRACVERTKGRKHGARA